MAEGAMLPHSTAPLPMPEDDWADWFLENARSFRHTLLRRGDGARLHAGLLPTADLERITAKIAFLTEAGIPEWDAQFAMLTASRFTVGSVLEEQADTNEAVTRGDHPELPTVDHSAAFEHGVRMIVDGLASRIADHIEP